MSWNELSWFNRSIKLRILIWTSLTKSDGRSQPSIDPRYPLATFFYLSSKSDISCRVAPRNRQGVQRRGRLNAPRRSTKFFLMPDNITRVCFEGRHRAWVENIPSGTKGAEGAPTIDVTDLGRSVLSRIKDERFFNFVGQADVLPKIRVIFPFFADATTVFMPPTVATLTLYLNWKVAKTLPSRFSIFANKSLKITSLDVIEYIFFFRKSLIEFN